MAVRAAEVGHRVVGYDVDDRRIKRLAVGVHVPEPVVPGQRAAEHERHGGPFAAVRRVEATPEELAAADAVVLLADHDDFDYEAVKLHAQYVLDCRNRLSGANVDVL
ncbi:hypothetical protein SVTN_15215 [Streptomyces vietnamensis]|uniref:UDP-glucose/GDP-mannose dehydrogenase C-terminal domain-containing protein n=1 Tax=Streptomyces vietnamensis TaxID=362257 RepID=A0A0B5HYU8_9ACTN|nr:hypothetical protein SVTN_15215 [Streptomyces vietnamensis]